MVAIAGVALWLGGAVFAVFAVLVALGIYWEWWGLVAKLAANVGARAVWMAGGAIYIGVAALALIRLRQESLAVALELLLMVIAVDIGAYFAGRAIGGPKIAPRISPSKTWAGFGGGVVAATLVHGAVMPWTYASYTSASWPTIIGLSLLAGAAVTVIAQCGDFFESWMKRHAGVKDSGALIPGHGGLLDRVDGLMAVSFFAGLLIGLAR